MRFKSTSLLAAVSATFGHWGCFAFFARGLDGTWSQVASCETTEDHQYIEETYNEITKLSYVILCFHLLKLVYRFVGAMVISCLDKCKKENEEEHIVSQVVRFLFSQFTRVQTHGIRACLFLVYVYTLAKASDSYRILENKPEECQAYFESEMEFFYSYRALFLAMQAGMVLGLAFSLIRMNIPFNEKAVIPLQFEESEDFLEMNMINVTMFQGLLIFAVFSVVLSQLGSFSAPMFLPIIVFFLIISFVPVMTKRTPESSLTMAKCRTVFLIILVVCIMIGLPAGTVYLELDFTGPALVSAEVALIIVWRLSIMVYRDELVPDGRIKVLETSEPSDPDNNLVQESSVSDLAFTMTMRQEDLAEIYPDKEIPFDSNIRTLTFFSALFTLGMQWLFCLFLFNEFLIGNKTTLLKGQAYVKVAKVIACIVFHFTFVPEINHAIKMIKFAALHPEKFYNRLQPIIIALLKGTVVIFLEFLLIWNLAFFTDDGGAKQVAFDFAALACIAQFDDQMVNVFNRSNILKFNEASIPFVRFVQARRKYLLPPEEAHFQSITKQLLDLDFYKSMFSAEIEGAEYYNEQLGIKRNTLKDQLEKTSFEIKQARTQFPFEAPHAEDQIGPFGSLNQQNVEPALTQEEAQAAQKEASTGIFGWFSGMFSPRTTRATVIIPEEQDEQACETDLTTVELVEEEVKLLRQWFDFYNQNYYPSFKFKERSAFSTVLVMIHDALRLFYKTVHYYILPFLFLSFVLLNEGLDTTTGKKKDGAAATDAAATDAAATDAATTDALTGDVRLLQGLSNFDDIATFSANCQNETIAIRAAIAQMRTAIAAFKSQ